MPDGGSKERATAEILTVEKNVRKMVVVAVKSMTGKEYVLADRITDVKMEVKPKEMVIGYSIYFVRTVSGISAFGEISEINGVVSIEGLVQSVYEMKIKGRDTYIGTMGKFVRWRDFYPLFLENVYKCFNNVISLMYGYAPYNWVISTGKYGGEAIDLVIFDFTENLESELIQSADIVFSRLIDEGRYIEM